MTHAIDYSTERPLPSKEFIYGELAKINLVRPLKDGSPPDRASNSLYSMASTGKTLRKAREAADALIQRRGLTDLRNT